MLVVAAVLPPAAEVRADSSSQSVDEPACPQVSTSDPKRTKETLRRLRSQAQGHRLLAAFKRPLVFCFGDVPEGILQSERLPGAVLVLERDRSLAANAARLTAGASSG